VEVTVDESTTPDHASEPSVQDLSGIFLIDSGHAGSVGTVGVYLVPGHDGGFMLIECSSSPSLPALEAGIREAGFEPEALTDVLVTHIHLDHAGAAGTLARRYGARVVAHEVGAPHLVDPARLIGSASRIYGDAMERLWGTIEPVPQAQLRAVSGGERLELAGHRIDVIHTPGHASHHLSYLLDGDHLFTGDAAAIRFHGSSVIRPATPPPETNLDMWEGSFTRMKAAAPQRLLLTHYGEVTDPAEHIDRAREQTHVWAQAILEGLKRGEDDEALELRIKTLSLAQLVEDGASTDVVERHRTTSHDAMTVQGLKRYWQKLHPEALEGSGTAPNR
jgi:glyoxylase-like metal-dependent hydrolase (beta-lactamase superfamily II)